MPSKVNLISYKNSMCKNHEMIQANANFVHIIRNTLIIDMTGKFILDLKKVSITTSLITFKLTPSIPTLYGVFSRKGLKKASLFPIFLHHFPNFAHTIPIANECFP